MLLGICMLCWHFFDLVFNELRVLLVFKSNHTYSFIVLSPKAKKKKSPVSKHLFFNRIKCVEQNITYTGNEA